jgi:hypothetical protein
MNRWLALAFAAAVAVGVGARPAVVLAQTAGVADPRNCSVDPKLIGSVGDPLGSPSGGFGTNGVIQRQVNLEAGFKVVVRDVNGDGIGGVPVFLDFTGTNIRLYDPPGHVYTPAGTIFPITVFCSTRLQATTSSNIADKGTVIFQCRFGGYVNNTAPVKVTVSAAGVLLTNLLECASTDLETADNQSLVNASDLNHFRLNLFAAVQTAETNFNLVGPTDSADLNIFRKDLFAPQNTGGAYCPI